MEEVHKSLQNIWKTFQNSFNINFLILQNVIIIKIGSFVTWFNDRHKFDIIKVIRDFRWESLQWTFKMFLAMTVGSINYGNFLMHDLKHQLCNVNNWNVNWHLWRDFWGTNSINVSKSIIKNFPYFSEPSSRAKTFLNLFPGRFCVHWAQNVAAATDSSWCRSLLHCQWLQGIFYLKNI